MTDPFAVIEVPFGKKKPIITKLFNALINENLSIVIFVKNTGVPAYFSNKNIKIYKSFSSGSVYLIDKQEKLKEGVAFLLDKIGILLIARVEYMGSNLYIIHLK